MAEQRQRDIVPLDRIEKTILLIRGERVILDEVLAALYGVTTKRLNEQVRRNSGRFPLDFMFQLSKEEHDNLKSQFATSSYGWGGRRKRPLAFTEHGAIMAASVLNTPRAVEMSIFVVRAFVRLRSLLAQNKALASKLAELESKVGTHDRQIAAVFEAIRRLMAPPAREKKGIGFKVKEKSTRYRGRQKQEL